MDPFCCLCLSLLYYRVCSLQPNGHLLGKAELFALLCVMFSCVLSLSHMVHSRVWYLTVSIPDLFILPYFGETCVIF